MLIGIVCCLQVVATVAQIFWARHTEAALRSKDVPNAMSEWQQQYLSDLSQLITRIQGHLTPLQRKIIIALITTDVHARDIIAELARKQIDDVHNFVWQQQLRYYWLADNDECVIHHRSVWCLLLRKQTGKLMVVLWTAWLQRRGDQVRVRVHGCHEPTRDHAVDGPVLVSCTACIFHRNYSVFILISSRSLHAWKTLRLTLTGSYKLKLGAAPAGPAGTGKTESSKDLAKAMAIQCVVFNCR